MTTAEITGAILTLNDVKALRQCDQVSISHKGPFRGDGCVRCVKKLEAKGPFEDSEREYLIMCESTVRYYFDDSIQTDSESEFRCHELLYNYRSSVTEIGTLASLLRVGDELSLHWIGSRNGYTREAGLHMDSLNIHLRRGKQVLSFMMSQRVCPNNTARMIQIHR